MLDVIINDVKELLAKHSTAPDFVIDHLNDLVDDCEHYEGPNVAGN